MIKKDLLAGFIVIIFSTFFYISLQIILFHFGIITGLFVPDAISLKRSLLIYDVMQLGFGSLDQIFNQVFSFYSLFILYYFTTSEYGFIIDLLVNLILTTLTWHNMLIFIKLGCTNRKNILSYSIIFWFLNPYYLSLMMFPNKEILLFFLTTLFARLVIEKKYIFAFIILPIVYVTRDGHAIALLCSLIAYFGMKSMRINGIFIIVLAVLLIALISSVDKSHFGGAFERNASVASEHYSSGSNVSNNKVLMVFVNWLNLAFRPQFLSNEGFYLINIGLWLSGITVFLSLPICFYNIITHNKKYLFGSLLVFSIFIALIVSSYSQQRYFLVFLPFLIILLTKIKPSLVYFILLCTIILNPFLYYAGILPPLQEGISINELRAVRYIEF